MSALRPVMFLDIDDVLCLSDPVGGYDVVEVVAGRHPNPNAVYRALFVPRARQALRQVHDRMAGQLHYVVSSTWRECLDREQMLDVFRQGGLEFVADCLHDDARWCTPAKLGRGRRVDEIAQWLDRHHRGEPFVIVDDSYSGPSLRPALDLPAHPFAGRVVLCEENVGLGEEHVEAIVKALGRPAGVPR